MRSSAVKTVYLVCRSTGNSGEACTPYLVCKSRDQADHAADHIEKWMHALFEVLPKPPETPGPFFFPGRGSELARERSAILDVVQWPYDIDGLKQTLPLDEHGHPLPGQVQVVELPVIPLDTDDPL